MRKWLWVLLSVCLVYGTWVMLEPSEEATNVISDFKPYCPEDTFVVTGSELIGSGVHWLTLKRNKTDFEQYAITAEPIIIGDTVNLQTFRYQTTWSSNTRFLLAKKR